MMASIPSFGTCTLLRHVLERETTPLFPHWRSAVANARAVEAGEVEVGFLECGHRDGSESFNGGLMYGRSVGFAGLWVLLACALRREVDSFGKRPTSCCMCLSRTVVES